MDANDKLNEPETALGLESFFSSSIVEQEWLHVSGLHSKLPSIFKAHR